MPRTPTFDPVYTASDGWMVSVPPSMTPTGKRRRRFFGEAKTRAEIYARRVRRLYHKGERQTLLTAEQSLQAAQAIALLEGTGITLLQAAEQARKAHGAGRRSEPFRERWLRYQKEQEGHWGDLYAEQVFRMQNWLSSEFMDTPAALINDEAITNELKRFAKSTRKRYGAMIRAVLSERGKEKRAAKIEILDRRQLALLKWYSRKNPEERRAVGLLLFAGVRPDAEDGEISRLDWETVGKEIYIDHEVAKTNTDRHIPITKRLRWWIRGHPADGPVIPSGWKRRWTRLRAEAGISGKDITRHSFASNFLAVFGEDRTKDAMGHTRGSDTLFGYYRKSVTRRDGLRYFGIHEMTRD